jgi:hypothetical protein
MIASDEADLSWPLTISKDEESEQHYVS